MLINLRSNFNSENLVKSETLLGIQIHDQISIIRNCSKVKLRHEFSLGLGSKVVKIAWNVVKVGVHACLSNGHPNL